MDSWKKIFDCYFCNKWTLIDEVCSECHRNQLEVGFKAGKKEGIEEVVEWIEHNARHDSWGNTLQEIAIDKQLIIDASLWQIKLDEWGVER